ncbi:MAG TPA: histidine kinase [Desulfuromonadales bacterium]|nr:histidine kinase [Desulfuromonadales bacterium]
MKQAFERYFRILQQIIIDSDANTIEVHLAEAFELGRDLVEQNVPPDEVTQIHHEAVVHLSQMYPSLPFAQVADQLSRPLIEMNMAYGMAFREQMERRYLDIVNSRLEQSNKLEAIGTLAAGIAHDFNNILASIISSAEMAEDDLPIGTSGNKYIKRILTASFRARDIVARMLTFARQNQIKPVIPVELVAQIREALFLLDISRRADVTFSCHEDIEQALVVAEPGQLQQIVMNLCINAIDAMNFRGVVTLHVEPAKFEDGSDAILLKVADNGQGMTPEVCRRIFDPFFTTKEPGKGNGLGLSVVHGIVTQLGGHIDVQSRTTGEHRGTEFMVLLPVTKAEC